MLDNARFGCDNVDIIMDGLSFQVFFTVIYRKEDNPRNSLLFEFFRVVEAIQLRGKQNTN
ncbi:MAG: hypothetical protein ACTSRP_19955 [Candidatus Helarchaeota archaeon]